MSPVEGPGRRWRNRTAAVLLTVVTAVTPLTPGTVPGPPGTAAAAGRPPVPEASRTPLPLEHLFDNRGISDDDRPQYADLDGSGASLSAGDLAAAGWTPGRTLTIAGAPLTWPRPVDGGFDNVRADGQAVQVTGQGDALVLLVTGTRGTATGDGTVRYRDGLRTPYRLTAPDWRGGPLATKAVALPHVNKPSGRLTERAKLYAVTVPLVPGREIDSVTLPRDGSGADLHVFAIGVRPSATGWSGGWATSTGTYAKVGPWTDRTLRLVVRTSVGGPRLRVRFDNTFASGPVRLGAASVAVRDAGATPRDTPVPLTFGGTDGTEIPAGAQVFSDPLPFDVPSGTDLLVSFHLPGTVRAAPLHRESARTSYLSETGDRTGTTDPAAFPEEITTWPLLTGVDVGGGPGSVVVIGDSITDASEANRDTDLRWTDHLTARLHSRPRAPRYGVLNQGISANRVLTDRYPGDGVSKDSSGVSLLSRLDRDAFAQTSARTLVVFQGVNDLRWGATAGEVLAGLREVADRARARGLRVVVATLTPCGGEKRCTAAVDTERRAVNDALRDGPGPPFDAVLDFDRVLRDPEQPSRMAPRYDSGDHLHPGDAGMAALADSVDLSELRH
ncbi:GDSL-type esterase/lipase family protein [Streptomyces uncialis]|uniref:GDSL-type esterase/lipase family protein n=1 Tax=Streptomyces uncialis TaxID=1048205 RepID=UPI0033E5DEC1